MLRRELWLSQVVPSDDSGQGRKCVHTVGLVVEEVVVLGDIRDDAEPIGYLHREHVFWIQQGRNPQLSLGHFKCLGMSKAVRNWKYIKILIIMYYKQGSASRKTCF